MTGIKIEFSTEKPQTHDVEGFQKLHWQKIHSGLAYDISRCTGSSCSVREKCQRFTDKAVGAYRVAYSDFSSSATEHKPCEYIIPVDFNQT